MPIADAPWMKRSSVMGANSASFFEVVAVYSWGGSLISSFAS